MATVESDDGNSTAIYGTDLLYGSDTVLDEYKVTVSLVENRRITVESYRKYHDGKSSLVNQSLLVFNEQQLDELLTVLEDYRGRLVEAREAQEQDDN